MQVATALGAILRDERVRQQPCGVFGSFGWSGEAVDELDKRLRVRSCGRSFLQELRKSHLNVSSTDSA